MLSLTPGNPCHTWDRRRGREYGRHTAAGGRNPRREIQVRPAGPCCASVLFYAGTGKKETRP
jgi:hypothetical protein